MPLEIRSGGSLSDGKSLDYGWNLPYPVNFYRHPIQFEVKASRYVSLRSYLFALILG